MRRGSPTRRAEKPPEAGRPRRGAWRSLAAAVPEARRATVSRTWSSSSWSSRRDEAADIDPLLWARRRRMRCRSRRRHHGLSCSANDGDGEEERRRRIFRSRRRSGRSQRAPRRGHCASAAAAAAVHAAPVVVLADAIRLAPPNGQRAGDSWALSRSRFHPGVNPCGRSSSAAGHSPWRTRGATRSSGAPPS